MSIHFGFLWIASASLVLSCSAAKAQDLYVSPKGDDTHLGTSRDSAFKTLSRAQTALREMSKQKSGDLHVFLDGGIYQLDAPLGFASDDSGPVGHGVFWQALPNQTPIISGGVNVTGWKLVDPVLNRWEAPSPLSLARTLWVNGRRALRTHLGKPPIPGAKIIEPPAASADGYSIVGDTPLASWANAADLEFIYSATQKSTREGLWTESRLRVSRVTSHDGVTFIEMVPGFHAAHSTKQGALALTLPSDVENVKELLRNPGEWYLDRKRGMISYIPYPDQNMQSAQAVLPAMQTLLTAQGTPEQPISNMTFDGITFSYSSYSGPNSAAGFVEAQSNVLQDGSMIPAAVLFQQSQNMTFTHCHFTHLGAAGLRFSKGTRSSKIIGNLFNDISGSNLIVGDVGTAPEIAMPTDERLRVIGNTISNNLFRDTVVEFHAGVPIFVGYAANTEIAHNEIVDAPYSAISLGWGWSHAHSYMTDNLVSSNRVDHYDLSLADGGAIYTLNDMAVGAISEDSYSRITQNYFSDQPPWRNGAPLYPDNGGQHILFTHNVLQHVPRWIFIHDKDISNITAYDNWTDTQKMENIGGKGIKIGRTHRLDQKHGVERRDHKAHAIMQQAGLQKDFAYLSLPAPKIQLTAEAVKHKGSPVSEVSLVAHAQASPNATILQVDFYDFSTRIGTARRRPFGLNLVDVDFGPHYFSARVTDSSNAQTVSVGTQMEVPLRILARACLSLRGPAVEITAAGRDINSRSGGVDLLYGNARIASLHSFPFTFLWSDVQRGTYQFTAVAPIDQRENIRAEDASMREIVAQSNPVIVPAENDSQRLKPCSSAGMQ